MSYTLHELRAADGAAFSPFCWRARMALAHKGIAPTLRRVRFCDIAHIDGGASTVPVLFDQDFAVRDSWDIATHLDQRVAGAAPLFPTEGDRRMAGFIQPWTATQLHLPIFKVIAADIWDALDVQDQPYFRESREKRLKAPLESVRENQAAGIEQLRANLAPLRLLLATQHFLGGEQPTYSDYVVFGALQWARVISPVALLEPDDAVQGWFERCLDLHGGVGRREPAYAERAVTGG